MATMSNLQEPVRTSFVTGLIAADARVERSQKTVREMAGVFLDEHARQQLDAAEVMYAVEAWKPAAEGTEGGLYWGNSTVFPGVVGEEYFMTRGHFHEQRNRAEYYATISGTGMLVLMDEQRQGWAQAMQAGTTHYIPGGIAHRVVNTGHVPLTFLACWPSDAGYDYATIAAKGFSLRVMRRNGEPVLVPQP